MKLRDYQENVIIQCRKEFSLGHKNLLVVAPVGAGKTIIAAFMMKSAKEKNLTVWFVVHKRELILQAHKAIKSVGLSAGIVSSGFALSPKEQIQVVGIASLKSRRNKLKTPDIIIYDECFVSGTMVSGKKIEDISIGDFVDCFDNDLNLQSRKVISVFKKNAPPILYKIHIGNQSLVCTGDHPIYTKNGWTLAKDLRCGDECYSLRNMRNNKKNEGLSAVLRLLLQNYTCKKKRRNSARKNDNKQPNEIKSYKREDVSNTKENRTQTKRARRQWKRLFGASRNAFDGSWRRLIWRVYFAAWSWVSIFWLSKSLQAGHCEQKQESLRGNRRNIPHESKSKREGFKKRNAFKKTRVESIEILERGSDGEFEKMCRDGFVYNLEVEELNTYTANSIAVHNCHHLGAKTWVNIHREFSELGRYQIGLTATPWRLDRVGLGRYFSSMILAPDISELIKMGNLSKFKAYARELADPSGVKTTMGDYDLKEFEKTLGQTFTSDVITEYKRHLYNKRAVLFASSVEQAIRFANEFNAQGIPAAYIDGEMENIDRDKIVKQLETGEIKVLTNYAIVTEGFDVPAIEGVIFTRPTMSLSLYIQMAGRALRPHADKSHAIILDHVGNILKHGLIDDKREWQLTDRVKKSKDKQKEISIKTCKKCFAANRSFNRYCDNCGDMFEIKAAKEIEVDDSSLVEVDRMKLQKARKREQAEAKTLEELIELAKKRKYKNPTFWAQTIMKSRRHR